MKMFIKSKQEWSQLKGHVQKLRPKADEVNFKLFSEKVQGVPRFELYITDSISNKEDMTFFICQNGREFDWLYSTTSGRQSLSEYCKQVVPGGYKRLVVVLLNMLHEYGTLEEVKSELSWLVSELKFSGFKAKSVPFLTEGSELGVRNIIGKGRGGNSRFLEPSLDRLYIYIYMFIQYESYCINIVNRFHHPIDR